MYDLCKIFFAQHLYPDRVTSPAWVGMLPVAVVVRNIYGM